MADDCSTDSADFTIRIFVPFQDIYHDLLTMYFKKSPRMLLLLIVIFYSYTMAYIHLCRAVEMKYALDIVAKRSSIIIGLLTIEILISCVSFFVRKYFTMLYVLKSRYIYCDVDNA